MGRGRDVRGGERDGDRGEYRLHLSGLEGGRGGGGQLEAKKRQVEGMEAASCRERANERRPYCAA